MERDEQGSGEEGSIVLVVSRAGNALHRHWTNTVVGRILIGEERLTTEGNSIARADELRRRVEEACPALLAHRARTEDPAAGLQERAKGTLRPPPPRARLEGELEALRDFKAQHYASWIDDPLPALAGLTPRQAVKKAPSRREVELLLRDIENHEARLPVEERFDLGELRRQLGLSER